MVIGAQWGDEGKGKIVDYLAAKADVVVRSQGGNNAGHTVVTGGKAYPLRLMPSGIMYPDTICIVGTGVVIDPKSLLEEMNALKAQGVDPSNLQISTRAHVVFPYHIRLDEAEEARKGNRKIGTTKNGIGPCYADKINRIGIRICDLMDKDVFAEKLKYNVEVKNMLLERLYGVEGFDYEQMLKDYLGYALYRRYRCGYRSEVSAGRNECAEGTGRRSEQPADFYPCPCGIPISHPSG